MTAIDPSALLFSDTGFDLDISSQASIQLSDSPTPPDATTVSVSLFQQNYTAFKGERQVSWNLTDAKACQYSTRA